MQINKINYEEPLHQLTDFEYGTTLNDNEIRLLQPAQINGGHLSFQIKRVVRAQAPVYTAISYTWGKEEKSETIILDRRKFKVTPNLWSCLYHIGCACRSSAWTCLWVDAICINQNDIPEKNCQVRQMDQIYRGAVCVSAWLGLPPPAQNKEVSSSAGVPPKTPQSIVFNWKDSIADLANRPYWTRRWIVQEFLLGRCIELYCGSTRISDDEFQNILYRKKANNLGVLGLDSVAAARILMARFIDMHPNIPQPLHHLLEENWRSECEDPRDRVFALLGLVHPIERQLLGRFFPDYHIDPDHVRIIALAHCRQNPVSRIQFCSNELALGLGVGTGPQMMKLWRRAEKFNYLDSRSPAEMLEILKLQDKLEEYGGSFPEPPPNPSNSHSLPVRLLFYLLDLLRLVDNIVFAVIGCLGWSIVVVLLGLWSLLLILFLKLIFN
ncbi:heterokaryon incompatibility protein-domain-containing protein [Hypoxylon rubiginosum]|uniref:Heterokaryon incompatibility protein-domain-containing protein n=1 Tax=Hypoxylon rubiginosum TaxID=110542 RepID=A0ACC0CN26_9PEZI|nr:heterokaryon incompatibility protein-domain-containing protein [Hypoxylon rubiginosum]